MECGALWPGKSSSFCEGISREREGERDEKMYSVDGVFSFCSSLHSDLATPDKSGQRIIGT